METVKQGCCGAELMLASVRKVKREPARDMNIACMHAAGTGNLAGYWVSLNRKCVVVRS